MSLSGGMGRLNRAERTPGEVAVSGSGQGAGVNTSAPPLYKLNKNLEAGGASYLSEGGKWWI